VSEGQELAGKTVLVTGGGRGIGRAIALAFARCGSAVALTGRSRTPLEGVAHEIQSLGGRSLPLTCDVTRKEEIEVAQKSIHNEFGPVQILVNNAGMAPAAPFLDMPDQLWEDVLKVNLTGTYYCCKLFLPEMVAAKWGRVINIASTVAKVGYSHTAAYTASKHAVLGLTRVLALEMARYGVTVNAICPGYVETEMTLNNARLLAEKTGKKVEEALGLFAGSSPQKRLIAPQEVAELALMLASKSADGITGQAINVDGGAVMV
jgi:NAD(P)-dependent dehydrogenase (short-subunit alcohol dehydrogenase family)